MKEQNYGDKEIMDIINPKIETPKIEHYKAEDLRELPIVIAFTAEDALVCQDHLGDSFDYFRDLLAVEVRHYYFANEAFPAHVDLKGNTETSITFRFAFREMRLLNDAWALVYQVFYKYQESLG